MNVRDAYNQWAQTYDTDPNPTRDLDQHATRIVLTGQLCSSILELGGGTGKNTAFLSELAPHIQVLDFSEEMLARARQRLPDPRITFKLADLTKPWPCESQAFDLVCGNLVLEHIADLGFIMREAVRCLKPGGQLFIAELHPFKQYLGSQAIVAHGSEPLRIPAFIHHTSEFLDAARQAGLTLQELREWWAPNEEGKPPRLISFLWKVAP